MDVLKFWRNGSHVVSLNWQHYDAEMQLNEAMFVGTPGWVLKPSELIGKGDGETKARKKLMIELVGVSSCQSFYILSRVKY
jgi:phosphatidylinositol phospholipase C, delta